VPNLIDELAIGVLDTAEREQHATCNQHLVSENNQPF